MHRSTFTPPETGCPELSLANGRISYSPSSYRTSTGIPKPVGTVVTRYRCDSGYTLFGQVSNRICQCDGTWSGPVSAVSCRSEDLILATY